MAPCCTHPFDFNLIFGFEQPRLILCLFVKALNQNKKHWIHANKQMLQKTLPACTRLAAHVDALRDARPKLAIAIRDANANEFA